MGRRCPVADQKSGRARGRPIYYMIVRSIQRLEVPETVLAPASAGRTDKAGFDKLTAESRNALH
jgi:hypothetical protein